MWRPIVLACALAIIATPVHATEGCNTPDKTKRILAEKYKEHVAWRGLGSSTRMLELWRNADGGTWTITVTDGRKTCVLASGEGWRDTAEKPAKGEGL